MNRDRAARLGVLHDLVAVTDRPAGWLGTADPADSGADSADPGVDPGPGAAGPPGPSPEAAR